MNERERAITVLNKQIPDRVPIFEGLIDLKVIKKIKPKADYADIAENTIDLVITNTPSLLYRKKFIDK